MFNIIICGYNNHKLSLDCIGSVSKYTRVPYHIIFVNDASTDSTKNMIEFDKLPNFSYLENLINLGYIESAVKGMKYARYENDYPFLFFLNNDVVLTDYWVEDVLRIFREDDVAAIGAPGHKEIADKVISFVSGSRLIIRKSVIDKVGFYDQDFKFGFWEDVDLSIRIEKAGYKIRGHVVPSEHILNATFKNNKDRNKYYEMNRLYLERKILNGKY